MTKFAYVIGSAVITGTFGFGMMLTGALAADVDPGCVPSRVGHQWKNRGRRRLL